MGGGGAKGRPGRRRRAAAELRIENGELRIGSAALALSVIGLTFGEMSASRMDECESGANRAYRKFSILNSQFSIP
ncbi:MAG TPA: hypothetical protein VFN10_02885, partial [Thermoanaerobaculia bacterium]|nr:hypothetical protein [Thermoanaerobaculia bacterium]